MELTQLTEKGINQSEYVEYLQNANDYNYYVEINENEITVGSAECYSAILQCGEPCENYDIKELLQCGDEDWSEQEIEEFANQLN